MDKLLLIFDGNWADEMDIKGFQVVDKSWWEKFKEKMPDKPFTHYVGSNQEMEFTGKDDYLSCVKEIPLTEQDAVTIKNLFPYDFGKFPEPEFEWEEDE